MKTMKKKTKTTLIIAAGVLLIAAMCFADYMSGVISYQNKVRSTIITKIDISEIPDGVYIGEYDVEFIYAKVSVTVESGVITEVVLLEHKNDRGGAAERIADDIVAEQKIDVDAVTGATNSSTVIKKAVENAFRDIIK